MDEMIDYRQTLGLADIMYKRYTGVNRIVLLHCPRGAIV